MPRPRGGVHASQCGADAADPRLDCPARRGRRARDRSPRRRSPRSRGVEDAALGQPHGPVVVLQLVVGRADHGGRRATRSPRGERTADASRHDDVGRQRECRIRLPPDQVAPSSSASSRRAVFTSVTVRWAPSAASIRARRPPTCPSPEIVMRFPASASDSVELAQRREHARVHAERGRAGRLPGAAVLGRQADDVRCAFTHDQHAPARSCRHPRPSRMRRRAPSTASPRVEGTGARRRICASSC